MVYQNYIIFPEKYFSEHLPRIEQNKEYLSFFDFKNTNLMNTIFIEACYACLSSAKDLNLREYHHITMESLTKDEKALENFLDEICQKFNIKSGNLNNIVSSQQKIKNTNSHRFAPKVFGYDSIKKEFNLEINNFNNWPEEWKLFCKFFFRKDFINYIKYYPNDKLVKFILSNKE